MNRTKKALLQEIKSLLRGPVPVRTLIYFEGEYHLSETLKGTQTTKIITPDRAKTILNDDPDCRVHFIYLTHKDPPEGMTDDLEIYEWIRANQIEPDIPAEIRDRINPPESLIIGVCDVECGEGLMDLFLTGDIRRKEK